ncbi:MAG: hypothetical protein DMF50_01710 [Acidobacteria bacterium]|nr:MAG: hypothetical protein DMF50_01710 [Acidobacteriota bacterium]
MKRLVIVSLVIVSAWSLWCFRPLRAGVAEIVLLDGPRGSWLATCRADAATTVLEEREGWRKVRVEGWVMGHAGEPAGGSAARVASPPAGLAVVRGVLQPASGPAARPTAGAGLVVLLVSGLEALDREHARAGEECRATVEEARRRVEEASAEYNRALASSDNFREAATRNDRLKKQVEETERQRRERIAACRDKALEIFYRHASQKTISETGGRFEFSDVAPGRYRVVAAERTGDDPQSWVLECEVVGAGTITLDSATDRSPLAAFWGLR